MVISKQKELGAYYTPDFIVQYILDRVFEGRKLDDIKICDPSCGQGAFLRPAAWRIYQATGKSIDKVIRDNIFGLDVDNNAISYLSCWLDRANLFCGNSTDIKFLAQHIGKYDVIIGNPPYVRVQNILEKDRVFLKDWECFGDCDLYTAFIRIGMSLLQDGGTLGFITANSYLKNKSTTRLVDWLCENQYITEICDFGTHHMFQGVSTYTGILICKKQKNTEVRIKLPKDCFGEHLKNNTVNINEDLDTFIKPYPLKRATFLVRKSDESFIEVCEEQQYKLKNDVRISVGLATLADSVFFIQNYKDEASDILLPTRHRVERRILQPCIKVSRLKDDGINHNKAAIIFPYHIWNGKAIPWTEEELKSCPNAYAYLQTHKDRLMARDKGKAAKYQWFHYGRSQGLTTLLGRKLLMPPMVLQPRFILSEQEDLLFLSGYAIFEKNSALDLETLKVVLESNIFNKYIHLKSKDFRSGYKACTKTLIQAFSIPHFTDEEKVELQTSDDKNAVIERKYGANT